ncbi:hypothetical protein RI065_10515 [Mycoplasmatota bacterium zrk1]
MWKKVMILLIVFMLIGCTDNTAGIGEVAGIIEQEETLAESDSGETTEKITTDDGTGDNVPSEIVDVIDTEGNTLEDDFDVSTEKKEEVTQLTDVINSLKEGYQISYEELKIIVDEYFVDDNFFVAGDEDALNYLQRHVHHTLGIDLPYWLASMKNVREFVENEEIEKGDQVHSILLDGNYHFSNPAWWDWYILLERRIPGFFELKNGYNLIVDGEQLVLYVNTGESDYRAYIDNLFRETNVFSPINPMNVDVYTIYTDKEGGIAPPNNKLSRIEIVKDVHEIITPPSDPEMEFYNEDDLKDNLIIGQRESVNRMIDFYQFDNCSKQSNQNVTQNEIDYASQIIVLNIPNQDFPLYIKELIPEVSRLEVNQYLSKEIKGKHIIILNASSESNLIKMIEVLPDDLFTSEISGIADISGVLSWQEREMKEIIELGTSFKNTDYGKIVFIPASPDKGFNFPYFIQLPTDSYKSNNINYPSHLIFETNNPDTNDDFKDSIIEAYKMLNDDRVMHYVIDRLHVPRVMPVTPRPIVNNSKSKVAEFIKPQDLDSTTMYLEDEFENMEIRNGSIYTLEDLELLKNYEVQMMNILDDAKERLADAGFKLEEKAFIGGFSTGGAFANRLSSIYPEEFKAVYVGGVHHPILPSDNYQGSELIYPVGIANHEYLFGSEFDSKTYGDLPKLFHLGMLDTNDPLWGYDTFTEEERDLLISLIGRDMPEKWFNIIDIYYELGGTGQFITNKTQEHSYDDKDKDYILEFFKINRGDGIANYNISYYHPNLEIRND